MKTLEMFLDENPHLDLSDDEQRDLKKRIGAFFESIPERFERGEK
jgi:hypothetical protein